jgi:hypothetical protein
MISSRGGFVMAKAERLFAVGKPVEATRVRITDAGLRVLGWDGRRVEQKSGWRRH